MTATFSLNLLGGFELRHDRIAVQLQPQARRVIAFLALQDRPSQRSTVAESLWPDRALPLSRSSLRSALFHIARRAEGLIELRPTTLALSADVSIDVRKLGDTEPTEDVSTGELLPEMGDEWLAFERERCRQRQVRALETRCRLLADARCFERAIEAGLRLTQLEPYRETAHRALIEAHLSEGNVGDAVRVYRQFESRLRCELDISPTASLIALLGPALNMAGTADRLCRTARDRSAESP